jgi:hypothetical protein
MDQSLPDAYKDTYQRNQLAEVTATFNDRTLEAFARKAEGVVYVLLPKGQDKPGLWKDGTVWDLHEWPNFGPGATKIIAVHLDDDEEIVLKGGS